jgi:Zn-dependent protease with chaperone function
VTLSSRSAPTGGRTLLVVLAFAALIVVFAAASGAFLGRSGAIACSPSAPLRALRMVERGPLVGGLTHATPLEKRGRPELYRLIENVSIAAGLPATPPIYSSTTPLRTRSPPVRGPRPSMVGVTTGLRKLMPARELEAVLAHEISHIRN